MINFFICIVIMTIINIICFCLGFFLSYLKFDNDFIEPVDPKRIFFRTREDGLEEAYIPEED